MNILLLAPHPFYQQRGSPIALNLLLQVVSERGDTLHVLTYHEGEDVQLPNVGLHRIPAVPLVRGVPPGFSWKKLICDFLMFCSSMRLVFRERYDLVYAIEESVFIALLIKWAKKTPYPYDMDSRLSNQLIEKYSALASVRPVLEFLERLAMRNARVIVPVSDGLLKEKDLQSINKVMLLRDVSLFGVDDDTALRTEKSDLRAELALQSACVLMYVGNLQTYQGIDLLLESFALTAKSRSHAHLVIIGGTELDIKKYIDIANYLGIAPSVHFLGPRPISQLRELLTQADILVSARVKGNNTPMKLYSYLHSGTATLLTDLAAHRQVASSDVALLVEPSREGLSEGMVKLIDDANLRLSLGTAAKRFVHDNNSFKIFADTCNELFDWLRADVAGHPAANR